MRHLTQCRVLNISWCSAEPEYFHISCHVNSSRENQKLLSGSRHGWISLNISNSKQRKPNATLWQSTRLNIPKYFKFQAEKNQMLPSGSRQGWIFPNFSNSKQRKPNATIWQSTRLNIPKYFILRPSIHARQYHCWWQDHHKLSPETDCLVFVLI